MRWTCQARTFCRFRDLGARRSTTSHFRPRNRLCVPRKPDFTRLHYRARKNKIPPTVLLLDDTSAATRVARQAVRESQIQTTRDQVLLVSAILWLPVRRPAAAGGSGRDVDGGRSTAFFFAPSALSARDGIFPRSRHGSLCDLPNGVLKLFLVTLQDARTSLKKLVPCSNGPTLNTSAIVWPRSANVCLVPRSTPARTAAPVRNTGTCSRA